MAQMRLRTEALRSIPLFQNLGDEGLVEIADLLIERKFPKNATIFEEGVPGDYMYLIQSGQVKVTKVSEDGREKILAIHAEGDFFGEMALVERGPRSASIKTMRPCVLLALSRNDFLNLLRRDPEISLELIRVLSQRLRDANSQVRALLFERVEGRARGILRRLAQEAHPDATGRAETPAVTHQQLADLVGTSRETITRVVKELKDSGWLQQEGKRYLVPLDDD
jgi:CRP-like cAMP-binding protein